uniref:TCF3 fusion partner n=1 Tax=Globodera pallida TaxID=36090 RepID=A0A183CAA0_GLOPA
MKYLEKARAEPSTADGTRGSARSGQALDRSGSGGHEEHLRSGKEGKKRPAEGARGAGRRAEQNAEGSEMGGGVGEDREEAKEKKKEERAVRGPSPPQEDVSRPVRHVIIDEDEDLLSVGGEADEEAIAPRPTPGSVGNFWPGQICPR